MDPDDLNQYGKQGKVRKRVVPSSEASKQVPRSQVQRTLAQRKKSRRSSQLNRKSQEQMVTLNRLQTPSSSKANDLTDVKIGTLIEPVPTPKESPTITVDTVKGQFMEWSLFQVWNNLAYATCSVPYRVSWSEHNQKFVLKYSRFQQFAFALQNLAALVEMASWWIIFKATFDDPSNPLKYVKYAGFAFKILEHLVQMKTTVFGMKYGLRLHNIAHTYNTATNNYKITMQKKTTILFSILYCIYLYGYSSLSIIIYTFIDQEGWKWGLSEMIQSFGCYARQKYIWATKDECPEIFPYLSDIPFNEYLTSGLGIYTYLSGMLFQEHSTLMLMTSCLTLLHMSRTLLDANGTEIQQPCFKFLEESAEILSSFIGQLLLVTLMDVACDLPKYLDQIFNVRSITTALPAIHIITLFLSFFAACVSARRINHVQNQITPPDDNGRTPQGIFWRLIFYLIRIFKRTVGIGYRNVFVINFPFMFLYCCSVASLVYFTYESENEELKTKNKAMEYSSSFLYLQ